VKFLFDHDVPDDMAYTLTAMGHEIFKLRELIHPETTDEQVLRFAGEHGYVLITCNRDDFLAAARVVPHVGLIILIRRNGRMRERAALWHLLDRAGEQGIRNNINFA
jgi:predicted nuclease of predicted toxin-antitoxin system